MRDLTKLSGPPDGYGDREPVTRRQHDRPWTADLETPAHADNRDLVLAEAMDAVKQTAPGTHVDIVTHERHGHPSGYLYSALESVISNGTVRDAGRCTCGGYVTRVAIECP